MKMASWPPVVTVNQDVLNKWLSHEYFKKPPPKSLDRDEWDIHEVKVIKQQKTQQQRLTAFTVQSIVKSLQHITRGSRKALYVSGRWAREQGNDAAT